MAQNGTVAYVTELPDCDFCKSLIEKLTATSQMEKVDITKARFDFKTRQGPWANGCYWHYRLYRLYRQLGMGKGQQLEVRPMVTEEA